MIEIPEIIEIDESGLTFGPFNKDSLFSIESSSNLNKHVKCVEFIWIPTRGNRLLLVEAKSSFSRPENNLDFDKNIEEICTKLVDSLTVLMSSYLGRNNGIYDELPAKFRHLDWSTVDIHMRLVIPNFELQWLPPITDRLRARLRHFLASVRVQETNFQVINSQIARTQGLVV